MTRNTLSYQKFSGFSSRIQWDVGGKNVDGIAGRMMEFWDSARCYISSCMLAVLAATWLSATPVME